jgi:hypothetical protein
VGAWTPAQLDSTLGGARCRSAQQIFDHLARAALDRSLQRDDVAFVVVRAD